eukprot:sb/3479282/
MVLSKIFSYFSSSPPHHHHPREHQKRQYGKGGRHHSNSEHEVPHVLAHHHDFLLYKLPDYEDILNLAEKKKSEVLFDPVFRNKETDRAFYCLPF